jgi:hypothetical protein
MVDMRILEAEIEFGFSALPEVDTDTDAGSMPLSRSVAASSSLTKFYIGKARQRLART